MNITIVGGSQGTGATLASQAIAAGHSVTVISRSGKAPAGATVAKGSATDPSVVSSALSGADAVIVTVGATKGEENPRAEVTRTVVSAMKDAGVSRIIVQSSLGAGDSAKQIPFVLRGLMKVILGKHLVDHDHQEAAVQASGLDWTIVRPSGLKDEDVTGEYQVKTTEEKDGLKGTVNREDVADFMLKILEDTTTFKKAYGISNK